MLDKYMIYSCGYVDDKLSPEDQSLSQLQHNKLEHICQKLLLKCDETILDLGSGYGGFLIYAAKNYGTKGIGFTISPLHHKISIQQSEYFGVSDKVKFYCQDLKFLDTLSNNSVD
jgi:cyclopropane-fatty-acyl-phospholipid synthase